MVCQACCVTLFFTHQLHTWHEVTTDLIYYHFTYLSPFFIFLLSHTRFDTAKGYGFIVPDNGDKDVFVHQTAINVSGFRSLAEGEAVEFKLVEENGKTKAIDVTGPDGADVKGAPFNPQSDEYEW